VYIKYLTNYALKSTTNSEIQNNTDFI